MSHKKSPEQRYGEIVAELGIERAQQQLDILKGYNNATLNSGKKATTSRTSAKASAATANPKAD